MRENDAELYIIVALPVNLNTLHISFPKLEKSKEKGREGGREGEKEKERTHDHQLIRFIYFLKN